MTQNNTEDIRRGSRNLTESKTVDGVWGKHVWDFATLAGERTISCISLTNVLAGKGTQYDSNYFVRLKAITSFQTYRETRAIIRRTTGHISKTAIVWR